MFKSQIPCPSFRWWWLVIPSCCGGSPFLLGVGGQLFLGLGLTLAPSRVGAGSFLLGVRAGPSFSRLLVLARLSCGGGCLFLLAVGFVLPFLEWGLALLGGCPFSPPEWGGEVRGGEEEEGRVEEGLDLSSWGWSWSCLLGLWLLAFPRMFFSFFEESKKREKRKMKENKISQKKGKRKSQWKKSIFKS